MKRTTVVVAFLAGLVLVAGVVCAQSVQTQTAVQAGGGKGQVEQLTEVRAKVEAIDLTTREVTLKGEGGKTVTVVAGDEVKRLAEVKVGDEVIVQYYESLTLKLDQTPGAAVGTSEKVSEERAAPTDLPGGIKTREVTITAKVTAVDTKTNTVSVVGPKGKGVDLEVDAAVAQKIKVGDLVTAVYREAAAVAISRVVVK